MVFKDRVCDCFCTSSKGWNKESAPMNRTLFIRANTQRSLASTKEKPAENGVSVLNEGSNLCFQEWRVVKRCLARVYSVQTEEMQRRMKSTSITHEAAS